VCTHVQVIHFWWNLKIARFIFISSFEVVEKLSFKLLILMCVHVRKYFMCGIMLWDPKVIKSIFISNFKVVKKLFLNFSCHYIMYEYVITICKCEIQFYIVNFEVILFWCKFTLHSFEFWNPFLYCYFLL